MLRPREFALSAVPLPTNQTRGPSRSRSSVNRGRRLPSTKPRPLRYSLPLKRWLNPRHLSNIHATPPGDSAGEVGLSQSVHQHGFLRKYQHEYVKAFGVGRKVASLPRNLQFGEEDRKCRDGRANLKSERRQRQVPGSPHRLQRVSWIVHFGPLLHYYMLRGDQRRWQTRMVVQYGGVTSLHRILLRPKHRLTEDIRKSSLPYQRSPSADSVQSSEALCGTLPAQADLCVLHLVCSPYTGRTLPSYPGLR